MVYSIDASLSCLSSRETLTGQKLVATKSPCNLMQFPRWHFPLEESQSHASTGGPLYLGSLPHKPAEQYFAVLPLRPPPDHKVSTSNCYSSSTCCILDLLSKLFTRASKHCHSQILITMLLDYVFVYYAMTGLKCCCMGFLLCHPCMLAFQQGRFSATVHGHEAAAWPWVFCCWSIFAAAIVLCLQYTPANICVDIRMLWQR